MIAEIADWYQDLDLGSLRVSRPSKFLFLCGGAVETSATARAANLRDYLVRVRRTRAFEPIVLAEEATQLYRDTHYLDLITFEEDIARLASIVLIIAESAGSLAELGAFTSNRIIRQNLRVVLPTHYEVAESFVRYGPVQRLKNDSRSYLGVYPWKEHKNPKRLNVSSVKPHYSEIKKFIVEHVRRVPQTFRYQNIDYESQLMYLICWIVYISQAVSPSILYELVRSIFPDVTDRIIRDKIYCLLIAKWIARESYSDKDYYYARFDIDPFDYKYLPSASDNSSVRRKLAVTRALRSVERVPPHVVKLAAKARVSA